MYLAASHGRAAIFMVCREWTTRPHCRSTTTWRIRFVPEVEQRLQRSVSEMEAPRGTGAKGGTCDADDLCSTADTEPSSIQRRRASHPEAIHDSRQIQRRCDVLGINTRRCNSDSLGWRQLWPGGRLLVVLSTKPAVTFPAVERAHR